MATLQEVQDAIAAYIEAQATLAGAQQNLVQVETAVNNAIEQELATFADAQTLFTSQLELARDAAGFNDALTAVNTAATDLGIADSTVKTLMQQYASV